MAGTPGGGGRSIVHAVSALAVLERNQVRPSESVAVIGDGKLGLLVLQVPGMGAEVVLLGRHPEKWHRLSLNRGDQVLTVEE